ncbi:MAG: single-stranded-DNA-specific exonuclease RecJ [Clostridiales bacterium]|nr:single-stranded-DNA-specific exonuclease RecJ [Clostridiales bacterium]
MYYKKLNKWAVNNFSDEALNSAENIASELGLTVPAAKLLINRGCTTPETAKRFIGKEEEQLYDPMLMCDMQKAVERICDAVGAGEKIVIYGDYDVDGVTSVASLYLYLRSLGADVSYHIPCRMTEGYGMSMPVIDRLADEGCDLIITVDTGITAVGEIAHAKELGIDVVVTDHHECHEVLPSADAIVNPRRPDCTYPFGELAGVGVVFKLLCAIESFMNPNDTLAECVRRISKEYCDLVAIGTIADVMPVKEENRLIVSYGLSLIERGTRPAITELINASGAKSRSKYGNAEKKKITAGYVGYTLAPRINAAGRIKNASIAVEMLITESTEEAKKYANELCDINRERQEEENRITEQAYAKIAAEHDFDNDPVIVLADDHWHHGIIGIVSSRITEKYGLPSILISFDGNGNTEISENDDGKGSGRSVKGLNLVEALAHCSELLEKYGGHELAAGLTVKRGKLNDFKRELNAFAREKLAEAENEVVIEAECELDSSDITMRLANELYYLEPYGVSNPVPVFRTNEMFVSDVIPLGGGKHTKLILKHSNMIITALCFRVPLTELDIYPGDVVDVLYNLDINEFQGTKTLQMIVKDIRLTENQLKKEIREHDIFDSLYSCDGKISLSHEEIENTVPDRGDFAAVYTTLKRELRVEHEVFSIRALSHLLHTCGHNISYVKLKFIITVFRELNLIGVEELDAELEIYAFKYIYVKDKINLDRSAILKRLKSEVREKLMK